MTWQLRFFAPIATALIFLCLAPRSSAQDNAGNQSWTTTSQQETNSGNVNPTRTTQTHTQRNGSAVDKTSVETLGPDGRFIPYSETERESVRVDATTVRSVERTFGRGPDGQRMLTQETQEVSRSLPDGETKIVRTTSDPNTNGALQVVRREVVDSKQVSAGVRDTNTTVFSADANGGLSPIVQVSEREKQNGSGQVDFTKSTLLSDGAGHWNLSEVREGTIKKETGQGTSKEERVLRPDSNGKLAEAERTVSKQTGGGAETRETTESYSTNVPGEAGNDQLQLVRRESSVRRTNAGSGQSMTRQVETSNPGNPGDGLQVTQDAIDIVRPDGRGSAEQKATTLTFGPDGQVSTVSVDVGRTNNPAAVRVDTSAGSTPK